MTTRACFRPGQVIKRADPSCCQRPTGTAGTRGQTPELTSCESVASAARCVGVKVRLDIVLSSYSPIDSANDVPAVRRSSVFTQYLLRALWPRYFPAASSANRCRHKWLDSICRLGV